MGKSTNTPVSLKSQIIPFKERHYYSHNSDFGRGPVVNFISLNGNDKEAQEFNDGCLLLPGACSLTEVALDLYPPIKPLFADIVSAWDRPGCADFSPDREMNQLVFKFNRYRHLSIEQLKSKLGDVWLGLGHSYITRMQNSDNPDVIHLLELVKNFINKGFNGPKEPIVHRVLGLLSFDSYHSPKKKTPIVFENAIWLVIAILYLAWLDYKKIKLNELDRVRMGENYELVKSTDKPSTEWGRSRKKEIDNLCTRHQLKFMRYKTIRKAAEKFYQAWVIRGSITDAASDFDMNCASTLEHQIEFFKRVTGIKE